MFENRPYDDDRKLLESMGLSTYYKPGNSGYAHLGQVEITDGEGGTIEVEVKCMPAQFWRFTIYSRSGWGGGAKYEMKTGSGALTDYWPIARLVAEGMLSFEILDGEDG